MAPKLHRFLFTSLRPSLEIIVAHYFTFIDTMRWCQLGLFGGNILRCILVSNNDADMAIKPLVISLAVICKDPLYKSVSLIVHWSVQFLNI